MTTTYSPPAAASAPREALLAMESKFKTFDGVELFYRAWLPSMPAHKAVILFHRGHEHSGRLAELAETLGLRDTAVFAWDARGHGRSPGPRGYADSFMNVVRDADCFVKHVSKKYDVPVENKPVVAAE